MWRQSEVDQRTECRSVDMYCVQVPRFWRNSVSLFVEKLYKLFQIGNEKGLRGHILLVQKWVDKVTNISRVSDRMIVINVLVQENFISDISVYALKYDLDNDMYWFKKILSLASQFMP